MQKNKIDLIVDGISIILITTFILFVDDFNVNSAFIGIFAYVGFTTILGGLIAQLRSSDERST